MERPALVVAIGRPGDRWIHRTPDDAKQHADDVIYRAQSLRWNGRCIEACLSGCHTRARAGIGSRPAGRKHGLAA